MPIVRSLAASAFFLSCAIAVAQPYPPAGPGSDPPQADDPFTYRGGIIDSDMREGRIHSGQAPVSAAAAQLLGRGPIVIAPAPGSMSMGSESGAFEVAVADQLGRLGYQTGPGSTGGQVAELIVTHEMLAPAEPPHSPVSGAGGVELGNHGSGVGLGIAIDMSKPLGPLISTRLEARILDASTHQILWNGYAEVAAREGSRRWNMQATAARLTAAMFKNFPGRP